MAQLQTICRYEDNRFTTHPFVKKKSIY